LLAGSVICGFSVSELMLILSRALQGIGQSLIATSATVVIVSTFPLQQSGRAIGIFLAAIYVGATVGPLVGGVLTEYLGWRSIFFLVLPLGLVSLLLLWQLRNLPDKTAGGRFDTIGGLISGFAICLTIYGFTLLPDQSGFMLLAGGLACLVGFIWWEKRSPFPLMNLAIFNHNRTLVFSNLSAFINYCATFALGIIISLYLQYIQGFSPRNAGLFLGVLPLVQSVLTPLAGRLSDRINSRYLSTSGMILNTAGLGLLFFISYDTPILLIVIALIALGTGCAFFVSPNTNAIMKSVQPSSYGVASATLAASRQIGGMLGLAIVTVVFSILIGHIEITPQYYPAFLKGIKFAVGIFIVLSFIGILTSYASWSKKNN
jgi:MFS family permease